MSRFKRGRDFAAWLGRVPRQHSFGGKEPLGRVSKEDEPTFANCSSSGPCHV
ncbi:transposase [Mesorhizobium sp. M0118]|uniref:transposase n=1 Tax=Mesorhizobium sp. M0118 TaxID=2956884 RepID=UPI0033395C65